MTPTLTLLHLYPDEMSIYGDHGNVLALVRRAQWRGIDVSVREVGLGDRVDVTDADLIVGGGGQDRGQLTVADDLLRHGDALRRAADDGVVMLAVCGTFQLFGRGFVTANGDEMEGIGIFDAETVGSDERLTGGVVVDVPGLGTIVGYENHSGLTTLGPDQRPLGTVLVGAGNDGRSGVEGAVRDHVYGTYLHGPVLPRNPGFADALLQAALARRDGDTVTLEPLDDRLEHDAAAVARARAS